MLFLRHLKTAGLWFFLPISNKRIAGLIVISNAVSPCKPIGSINEVATLKSSFSISSGLNTKGTVRFLFF